MATPNLSEIITTTLRNRATEVRDNVTEKNALLTRLKSKGKITELSGGREIVKPLTYAENSTFQWFSGYDVLDISPSDVITSATYDMKLANVSVSVTKEEELKNQGPERLLPLVETRITNAMNTLANQINIACYSDGTGSGGKEIGGLQLLVADTNNTGTPGGIDASTYTFWRNVSYDATTDGGAAASATNITGYMNTVYNNTTRGVDQPDLIPADLNYFNFYLSSLQTNKRFADDDMADASFRTLKFNAADVVLESSAAIPTNHMYFLNTDYLGLDVFRGANMEAQEEKASVNQLATVVPILFAGNLTMSNRSLQGVLKD